MIANLIVVNRILGGESAPTYPPTAEFTSNTQSVSAGGSINYTDQSTVDPLGPPITSWYWQFEGGNPTESYTQNPTGISYANEGTYDVSLTVTNADGQNTKLKQDYITVNPAPIAYAPINSFFVDAGFTSGSGYNDWSGVQYGFLTQTLS